MLTSLFTLHKVDDKFYISSINNNIKVFDTNGAFIRQIGKLGNGPGEFSPAYRFFYLGEKKFLVYDFSLKSVLIEYNDMIMF